MKINKVLIETDKGTITIDSGGLSSDINDFCNEQQFSFLMHYFHHCRVVRDALQLKPGDSLYKFLTHRELT